MLVRISTYFTKKLFLNGAISEEDKDIYVYGFQLLISNIFNFFLLILSGVILKHSLDAVVYILVLMSLRPHVGGYHANSYFNCCMIYIAMFIVVIFFTDHIGVDLKSAMVLMIFYFWLIFRKAPMVKRRLTDKEIQRVKNKSIWRSVGWNGVIVILFVSGRMESAAVIYYAMMVIGIFVLVEAAKETNEKYG